MRYWSAQPQSMYIPRWLSAPRRGNGDLHQNERCDTVGDFQADPKQFEDVSPLLGAARIEVPVLLGHGTNDQRVLIVHSQEMLEALKATGKEVEWIELRGEGHGIAKDSNRERFYGALFEFLARNTRPVIAPSNIAPVSSAASAPPR